LSVVVGPALVRRAARRGAAWLPAGVRVRALRRIGPALGRRLGVGGAEIGLVSMVVVVEPADEQRLADCLDSLRAQWHALLDVLVCPVGEVRLDGPVPDPRFRVLPAQPTWYDAANAGAARAGGAYLGLVRACDTLPPHAVTDLAGTLARSGSDVAVGHLAQRGHPEAWLERTQRSAHGEPGTGLSPADRVALVGDLALGNKMVRLDFWRSAGLRLDAGDDWLTAPTWSRALARGPRIDVVPAPVVRYAHDHGHRPFGASPSPLPELPAWRQKARLVEDAVAGTPLARGWLLHVLDVALPRFLLDAERADAAQWRQLVELTASYRDRDEAVLRDARAESRALTWLTVQGRRAELESLAAELADLGEDLPTRRVGDHLVADWSSLGGDLPDEVTRLTGDETRLLATVQRTFVDGPELVADLFVRVRLLDLAVGDPTISAHLADGTPLPVVERADKVANRWAQTRFQSAAEGSVRVRLPLPAAAGTALTLTLRTDGFERQGLVTVTPPPPPDPGGPGLVIEAVDLEGDDLVVRTNGDADGLRLVGHGLDLAGRPGASGEQRFDTNADLFGRPVRLPSGRYTLRHPDGVRTAARLRDALPVEVVGRWHRLRVLRDGRGSPALHLGPPIRDDEIGAYGQEQLRRAYADTRAPTRPDTFYFDSYAGRSATDSPLAIFTELIAQRPGIRALWGVQDHGQWVPDGARPVLLRSREWYDALASARVLVTNTELEEWYVNRPDQLVLQTFHGYPSKAMGELQWRARQLPPSRVRTMRARSVDTWDLILTPTPEMTRHYREQYGYTGPAHEHGYPRDDALTGGDAAGVRQATRARLGIRDDQTAVLYAPTWRDHLAIRPRGAALSDHLDVPRAADLLGDGYVLLLRGHRFHSVPPADASDGSSARVLDVTGHPEVNDLVLASDVAVLDYSSLRFDYAQTGKPMVFLVPDLDSYSGALRGFLFPFEESAPGPFVATTVEVVEQLRDVDGLRSGWADRLAEFNAAYNPWQDGKAAQRVVDRLRGML
jgi:CDP-glycerol glycerophosphotransferase (TagB/SpsB family)